MSHLFVTEWSTKLCNIFCEQTCGQFAHLSSYLQVCISGVEVLDGVLPRDEEECGGLTVGAVDVDGAVVEDVLAVGARVVLHVVLHRDSHVALIRHDLVAQRR